MLSYSNRLLICFDFFFCSGAVDADGRIEPGDLLLAVSKPAFVVPK